MVFRVVSDIERGGIERGGIERGGILMVKA